VVSTLGLFTWWILYFVVVLSHFSSFSQFFDSTMRRIKVGSTESCTYIYRVKVFSSPNQFHQPRSYHQSSTWLTREANFPRSLHYSTSNLHQSQLNMEGSNLRNMGSQHQPPSRQYPSLNSKRFLAGTNQLPFSPDGILLPHNKLAGNHQYVSEGK
jgi:hypothetical protein